MFERLSEPARRAIFWAKGNRIGWARKRIEPTHLLTGILFTRRPEVQREILRAHGVNPDGEFDYGAEADLSLGIPVDLEERLFRPLKDSIDLTGWTASNGNKTVSWPLKAVIESAVDGAGRGKVQLSHFMTALISCDDPLVKEQLEKAGIL